MSKFCYEEGELRIAQCQCELCLRYNGGARSPECPEELMEEIQKNLILCPKIKRDSIFDR